MLFLNDYIAGLAKAEGRVRGASFASFLMGIESALFQKSVSLKRSICTAKNQAFPMTELLFGFYGCKIEVLTSKIHGMCYSPPFEISSTGIVILRVWYKIS